MTRTGDDGPGRLLWLATRLLPPDRAEWGRAMGAELAALNGSRARWVFAVGCLWAASGPGQLARAGRYALAVAASVALATVSGSTGALRAEVIALGLAAPVVLGRLGRRDGLIGAVGPSRAARVGRRIHLAVLAGCLGVGVETIAVTLPRYGGAVHPSGAVAGLTLLTMFLTGYAALGLALTSRSAGLPAVTLAGAGAFGTAAGLAWCGLMPFDQTLSVPGPGRVLGYGLALAAVVVGAPATAAGLAVRRSGDARQGVLAGAGTGGLAALVILAVGWTTVGYRPGLLYSPLLDKGPGWRPPDVVEQVITSYLLVLVLAPLLGALSGWLAATVAGPTTVTAVDRYRSLTPGRTRVAGVAGLAIAATLVYPGVTALVGRDGSTFGAVGATDVVYSPAGDTVLTDNRDRTWILWSVSDPAHPYRLATFTDQVVYAPDGRGLASRDVLWRLAGPTRPVRRAGYDGGVPVAYSPDGTLLATHPTPTSTTLWRLRDGGHPVRLGRLATGDDGVFTPDGRTYLSRGDTATTRWDVRDPARPIRLGTLPGGAATLSPDGGTLATGTPAGLVLWNLSDRYRPRRVGALPGTSDPADPDGGNGPVVFSPDGRTAAVPERDGGVRLFDAVSAVPVAVLPATPGRPDNDGQLWANDPLTTIAYAPDGRTLTVITGNATASVWDLTDRARPVRARVLTRPAGPGRIGFAPDTTSVAGAATDGSNRITLWPLR